MWISAILTTVYGIILVLSHYPFEIQAIPVGISVAILPFFYALLSSLLLAPLVIRNTVEKSG
jgi:hypothetical protein